MTAVIDVLDGGMAARIGDAARLAVGRLFVSRDDYPAATERRGAVGLGGVGALGLGGVRSKHHSVGAALRRVGHRFLPFVLGSLD